MAKKLLGLVLAILMAVPTTSFAQEDDSLKGVRSVPPGARVRLEMRDGDVIQATLVRVEADHAVVRGVDASRHARTLRTVVIDGDAAYLLDKATVIRGGLLVDGKPEFTAKADSAEPELAALTARRLGVGATVEIRMRDGGAVRGKVSQVGDATLVIGKGKKARAIPYADMAGLRRAPMPQGVKVAAIAISLCGARMAFIVVAGLAQLAAEG